MYSLHGSTGAGGRKCINVRSQSIIIDNVRSVVIIYAIASKKKQEAIISNTPKNSDLSKNREIHSAIITARPATQEQLNINMDGNNTHQDLWRSAVEICALNLTPDMHMYSKMFDGLHMKYTAVKQFSTR